jgi:hypothetical protein
MHYTYSYTLFPLMRTVLEEEKYKLGQFTVLEDFTGTLTARPV